jgi:hypothetical protein
MKKESGPRSLVEVCPDCDGLSRRSFLRTVGGALAAGAAGTVIPAGAVSAAAGPLSPAGAPARAETKPAETYVKLFYESLTQEQRKIMLFPFDHPLRKKVANNWNIVDEAAGAIGKLYTADQKELIRQIFRGVTSEDGYQRFQKQMQDDAGGFEKYTCAVFGRPGQDKFEWVMTGRHLTIRADGNSVENTAFGGPIFYGHAVTFNEKPDHPGNVWWHQSRLANDVFKSLDGKQREKALLPEDPPDEMSSVALRGPKGAIPGLAGMELTADQRELLEKTLKSFLSMYRQSDVDEALECIKENGGLDTLRLSFYRSGDLGNDGIWDRWRVEGPAFVWYFRGSPHVHTWVNIAHRGGEGSGENGKKRLRV